MLTVRKTEPDDTGGERELYAIEIPRAIEAEGGDAIDAYVAAKLTEELERLTAPTSDSASETTSDTSDTSDTSEAPTDV